MLPIRFLLCMVFFASFSITWADTVPQSRRTGPVFDSTDVRYFKLFPHVDSIRSAYFDKSPHPDSVVVHARRSSRPDTVFAIHSSTATSITRYIDNFEAIFTGEYTVVWDEIAAFVRPVRPILEQQPVQLETRDGSVHNGLLFGATPSLLLLYTGNRPTDWTTYAKETKAISFNELAGFNGRHIGGNHEIYLSSLPYINGYRFFIELPPECRAMSSQTNAAPVGTPTPSPSLPSADADRIFEQHYLRRWHITVFGGMAHMSAQFDLSHALGVMTNAAIESRRFDSYPYVGVDVSYSITRRLHTGISLATMPFLVTATHPITEGVTDIKDLSGSSIGASVMYSLLTAVPEIDDPFEWQISAGAVYNDVIVTTTRKVYDTGSTQPAPARSSITSESDPVFTMFLGTSLQYYFYPAFSLRLSGERVIGESARVNTNSVQHGTSIPPTVLQTPTEIIVDRLNLVFGVSLHL